MNVHWAMLRALPAGRRRTGVVATAVSAVAAAALVMGAATDSQAATPPTCHAPSGKLCIAIENRTKNLHSFRWNPDPTSSATQCLISVPTGKTAYWPDVFVAVGYGPALYGYENSACGGRMYYTSRQYQQDSSTRYLRIITSGTRPVQGAN